MTFIYIILGLIQGLTEPIPISSSGHVIIFKSLFNIDLNDLNFEIFVNFGSFLAILFIFRKDIITLIKDFILYLKTKKYQYYNNFKYCLLIVVGTVPACIIGFIFKDIIEAYFSNIKFIGIALLITAFALFIIRKLNGTKSDHDITYLDAIKIGLFQAVALLPGISRSGATIVGSMLLGLKRKTAFKYSFMLYIPISLATMVLGITEVTNIPSNLLICYILGAISAFILTYLATKWFKDIMIKGKLIYFVYYCLLVGVLVILFL